MYDGVIVMAITVQELEMSFVCRIYQGENQMMVQNMGERDFPPLAPILRKWMLCSKYNSTIFLISNGHAALLAYSCYTGK